MLDKIIHLVQSKLGKLEMAELEELTLQSQDEAVRISLMLAAQPAPPMPEFTIDSKYKNPEKLADIVDDLFKGKTAGDNNYPGGDAAYGRGSKQFDDDKSAFHISDAEALKACNDWKEKYNVVIGVSWGSLPYDLQQKWMTYSCDYHLNSKSFSTTSTSIGKTDSISK